MSGEIIIGQTANKEVEQIDDIHRLVNSFATNRKLSGQEVLVKKINNGDGSIVRVERHDHKLLEVKYSESMFQINVIFNLQPVLDDQLIRTVKNLAEVDKEDLDRFFIEEDKNTYGAILFGFDQFKELFPKMYS
ncbi:gp76 [Bacillus phage G]|uniref:Gp76 n=1 Tax=Bacillus phage G TaxID=2884420 RepID=G3MBE6_9CAUD|nr:gp76 [Bacillus phage G]AEO93347.1 gp76 [Bacillus phage G]